MPQTIPKGLKMDAVEQMEIRRLLANSNTPLCDQQLFSQSPILSEKLTLEKLTLSSN
jgi:hypothetical protein